MVISEIDVERLRGERLTNTTFAANIGNCPGRPAIHISTEFVNTRDLSLTRSIEAHPFVPQGKELDERCEEIFAIQIAGLAKRLVHTHCKTVVVGISGGLDSTLHFWSVPRLSINWICHEKVSSASPCLVSVLPTVLITMLSI